MSMADDACGQNVSYTVIQYNSYNVHVCRSAFLQRDVVHRLFIHVMYMPRCLIVYPYCWSCALALGAILTC